MNRWIRTTLAAGLLLLTAVATAPAGTEGPATLTNAEWNPEAGVPEGSEITDEQHILTTVIPSPPTDLVATRRSRTTCRAARTEFFPSCPRIPG